jgi:hypothetical protein
MLPVGIRDSLSTLSGAELKVWICYMSHANKDGIAWPGRDLLCDETGLSPETVSSARSGLKRKLWLIPVHDGRNSFAGNGKFGSPRFKPVVPDGLNRDGNLPSHENGIIPSRENGILSSRTESTNRGGKTPSLSSSNEAYPKELIPQEGGVAIAPDCAQASAYLEDDDDEIPF